MDTTTGTKNTKEKYFFVIVACFVVIEAARS